MPTIVSSRTGRLCCRKLHLLMRARTYMYVHICRPLLKMKLQLACVLCLVLPLTRAATEDPPVVTTSQGRIVGTTFQFSPVDPELSRNVAAYLGIPYAEPPVGPLRFKPPVAKSWSGELRATEIGNRCPQPIIPMGNLSLKGNISEDCLFLDVFVPQPVPPQAGVLVYIHSGGLLAGTGLMGDFYPTPIAAVGDVIVVTLNYRLGALGFLSTEDDVVSGNMGLLDQRLAMEWVRDNIKAFGGDPGRVAVFGSSSGAASVGLHMLSPGSAGLFRGAIMQSGEALASFVTAPVTRARRRAFVFGKLVGCERETSQELLECLQQVEDFKVFIENQQEKLQQELGSQPCISFTPVVDGNFLPGDPNDLYAEGAINDAVSIIGANADQGRFFLTAAFPDITEKAPILGSSAYDAFTQPVVSMISAEPIVAEVVKLMYRDASCKDAPDCNYLESASQVIGDVMFVCLQDKTARAFTKAGRKVYRYHMTHGPISDLFGYTWTKSTHCNDLLFVFGLPLQPSEKYTFTEDEARMSAQTIKYWANLAKTGNPNLSSLDAELTAEEETEWPLFTIEELAYKDLSPAMRNGRGIKARECLMWNEFIPRLDKIAEEAKCRQDGDAGDDTCTKETCP